jgi:prolyl-tRNA editing enzyme YbaK/EbsC (Cys-tRNA(Pro) deacylase)
MIEKTIELMNKFGIDAEIIEHPETNGTHSEVISAALKVPLDHIVKCLILKSKSGNIIAAIILGSQRLDMKKLEAISKLKKLSLASEKMVFESTGYRIGGVPPIAVINVMPTFVDTDVLKKDFLLGSAGTPFHGFKFEPSLFNKFNYILYNIHK